MLAFKRKIRFRSIAKQLQMLKPSGVQHPIGLAVRGVEKRRAHIRCAASRTDAKPDHVNNAGDAVGRKRHGIVTGKSCQQLAIIGPSVCRNGKARTPSGADKRSVGSLDLGKDKAVFLTPFP